MDEYRNGVSGVFRGAFFESTPPPCVSCGATSNQPNFGRAQ